MLREAATLAQERALKFSVRHTTPESITTFPRLGASDSCVNLMLPRLPSARTYAGIQTALKVGISAGHQLGTNLRLIAPTALKTKTKGSVSKQVEGLKATLLGSPSSDPGVEFTDTSGVFSPRDVWIATYWRTAMMLSEAVSAGKIREDRIVYLIQDYEPGFFPWGDNYCSAEMTYRRDFLPLVNSTPLAKYLTANTPLKIDEDHVFEPTLDYQNLEDSFNGRRRGGRTPTLLFYARPNKPRNLFELGAEALARWAAKLDDEVDRFRIVSAGAPHPTIRIPKGPRVHRLGKLSYNRYLRLLSETDIALALMYSPHPSHVPLEAACAGSSVVTNRFGDYRHSWHGNIYLAEPSVEGLAQRLVDVSVYPRRLGGAFATPQGLGRPLADAVRSRFSALDMD